MSHPLAEADIHALQRRESNATLQSLKLRGPSSDLPAVPCPPALHQIRIKKLNRQISRSYVDSYNESILDEHMRKIEAEGLMRQQRQHERESTGSGRQSKADLRQYRTSCATSVYSLYSRPSTPEQRPKQEQRGIQRANTTSGETRPGWPLLIGPVQFQYAKGSLRRLSLGDVSGWLWDD
jgi:hypothetical protein